MDGTYDTHSVLTFQGTRWENELNFSCSAVNDVIMNLGRDPMAHDLQMDVRCKFSIFN